MQKVTLILTLIEAAQELHAIVSGAHPRVVARGDFVGPELHGVVQKGVELDFGVAQHVGVGRAAGLILAQEFGENALLVFLGEVDGFKVNADLFGGAGRIEKILTARAVLAVVVVFPVFHENAGDVVPLLL